MQDFCYIKTNNTFQQSHISFLSHSGVDYRDDTALLTLRAGATENCTNFIIINDLAEEGNETFSVILEALFPISIDISAAVVTIIDDDS